MRLIDAELVKEHLTFLVGMHDLDPTDKPHRGTVDESQDQMVPGPGQEGTGEILGGLVVEEMGRRQDQFGIVDGAAMEQSRSGPIRLRRSPTWEGRVLGFVELGEEIP